MPANPALPTLFDRGIHPDTLATVRQRFMNLNRQRLQRARSVLKARQQLILDLLPLLFHTNHPALPGYVGAETPTGLDHYVPSAELLQRVKSHISPSFDYRPSPNTSAIHSLFLMGSSGTVAHGSSSDLDIWLCHRARMSQQALAQLQRKAQAVSQWAASLGLEIHIFLMESERFRQGQGDQLSAESAGTSQHLLLLDEFYRSAILMAGRYPIWWLVPPEEEVNYREYTAILRTQGYISAEESIDFGGVAAIPAGEFIGAGIWQLYKAISAPYKAILKLLLTEAYAREFPKVAPLSLQFKAQVHGGEVEADHVDPYVMVYRKLEQYLQARGEAERLELVRRAFYFKTGQHLSRPAGSSPGWQQGILAGLVAQWQWSVEQLVNLDTQHRWKLRRVREEHQMLVAELTNSYRFLQEFAGRTQGPALINSQEMNVLGRKLYAAFERKRNKIERLNPGIALNLSEEQLFFRAVGYGDQRRWLVSNQRIGDQPGEDVLNRSDHLSALLCWCHCNGLIGPQTRLRLCGNAGGMDEKQLLLLSQHLCQRLPATVAAADPAQHAAFSHPKHPLAVLIYANLGLDAISSLGGSGSPSPDNAFPITQLEMVIINSWGEVMTVAFHGPEALIDGLKAHHQLLLSARPSAPPPAVHFACFHDPTGELQDNLTRLVADLQQALQSNARFVLKLSNGFYLLHAQEKELKAQHAIDYADLIQCLGRGDSSARPFVLERHCLANSPLARISQHSHLPACQVFLLPERGGVAVYVSDERGALVELHRPQHDLGELVAEFHGFLQAVGREQRRAAPRQYFLLQQQGDSWETRELSPEAAGSSPPEQGLHAIARRHGQGRWVFDFLVGGQRFPYQDYGQRQLRNVAQALIEARQSEPYIISLALGEADQQSSVYLRYKRHLESLVQGALEQRDRDATEAGLPVRPV